MSKNIRTFFIFATFLCALAKHVPEDSSQTILNMMLKDSKVCKFPPQEALQTAVDILSIAPCAKQVPHIKPGDKDLINGIRQYATRGDDNYSFLCMGLYDLSTKICNSSIPENNLINNTKDFIEKFDDSAQDFNFCNEIQAFLSVNQNVSDNVDSNWVQVLDENLARPEDCKDFCIRKRNVIPICRMLLWGRKLLHDYQQFPPKKSSSVDADTTEIHFEQEHGNSDSVGPAPDLEAKDLVDSEDHGIPPSTAVDSKSPMPEQKVVIISGEHTKEKPKSSTQNITPSSKSDEILVSKSSTPYVHESDSGIVSKSLEKKIPVTPSSTNPSSSSVNAIIPSSMTSLTSESSQSPSESLDPIRLETEDTLQGIGESKDAQYPNQFSGDATAQQDIQGGNSEEDDNDDNDLDMHEEGQLPQQHQKEVSSMDDVDIDSQFHRYNTFRDAEDSHFFAYFLTLAVICIIAYLVFHNKNKILALVLEGRKGVSRNGRGTRRPSTSSYRKLDSTLEEAISSSSPRTNSHVIY